MRLILTILALVCFSNVFAQNKYADLKKNLENGQKIESSLKQLSKMCEDDHLKITDYIKTGLHYSKKFDKSNYEVEFHLHSARIKFELGDYENCLKSSFEAEEILRSLPNERLLSIKVHIQLGEALIQIGSYQEAIDNKKEHIKLIKPANRHKFTPEVYDRIGILYLKLNENDSAKIYFKKAQEYAIESKDPYRIAFAANNVGVADLASGNLKKANLNYIKALEFYSVDRSRNSKIMEVVINGNLCSSYSLSGDYSKSEYHINKAIKIGATNKFLIIHANSFLLKAQLLSKIKKHKKSNLYLDSVNALYTDGVQGVNKKRLEVYDEYYKNYKALNNFRVASHYSELYNSLSDSLYGKEKMDELYQSRAFYHSMQIQNVLKLERALNSDHERHILLLEKKVELSTFKSAVVVLSCVLFLSLAVFLIFRLKRKNEIEKLSNKILRQIQSKDIKTALAKS